MKVFGLVGKTLSHSFSQAFFEQKFRDENIVGCAYKNFELADIDLLPGLLKSNPEVAGLNVTIPYKEAVLPFLTGMDEVVKATGACNCIEVRGKELFGYNTDVPGFSQSLLGHLKAGNHSAVVLGNGGASKAVQFALHRLQIPLQVVSRTAGPDVISYAQVTPDIIKRCTVIINTTPLGTSPDVGVCPPIPYASVGPQHLLFDLVYNPVQTLFLKNGADRGAGTCNGYEMLVLQALESWRIWTGASGGQ
jgi:shikimate dehydrogenase